MAERPWDEDHLPLVGKDVDNRPTTWLVRVVRELPHPDSALVTEVVRTHDGTELVRRSLPVERGAAVERLLDNEIRALNRVGRRYPGGRHPGELPRLVGFDFDSAEPFALLSRYPGPTVGDTLRTLLTDERRKFTVSLFRALAQLAAVDLVHGAVGLSSMCWDGAVVRLIGFEHALLAGERVRPGVTPAHLGDDVLAAGLVVHRLMTGRAPARRDAPPDLTGAPDAITSLLRGVFDQDPGRRPAARDLLERLGAGGDLPEPLDPDTALRAGRERFDRARPAKAVRVPPPPLLRPDPAPPPPTRGPVPPVRRPAPRRGTWPLLPVGLVVVLLAATVVLLVVTR
ncbi:hypothetical protein AB0I60_20510 [Actinosynnema sp. NPDC050436]|uniref:hypothetical protein n=1 Tax=Actinosynnema sp. NPDC050436 TaxID=3155659 RepID=UPI0033C139EE